MVQKTLIFLLTEWMAHLVQSAQITLPHSTPCDSIIARHLVYYIFIHFYGFFLLSSHFYVYVKVYDVLMLLTEWISRRVRSALSALPAEVTCLRCGVAMCSMPTVCLSG